ncbi:hypothetical protein [Natronoglomus mannanivorans]|uniref:WD40-like Beta Propeller Repeat n=1 Tax=Natronoglomus mannanivorans TaxID=2979990 RepID=A0AAP2Z0S5_9EURY|nr:hypothetical protein [Halobacteria archaeon AArc-xg1-1]
MSTIQHVKNRVKGTGFEQVLGPLYVYGKYLASGGYGFDYELNHGVKIMSPAEWAGVDHEQTKEFFGYYDKTPWSSNMTSFLTHCIRGDTKVDIVVYDRESSSRRVIADTSAWNHQQGAMIQWIEPEAVIYNDIVDSELQSLVIDTQGSQLERYPVPVQTVSPDGDEFLAINYRKFDRINPQYGYGTTVDNFDERMNYSDDGIWRVDRSTDEIELVLTLADVIEYDTEPEMENSSHWINHIMYSPDGSQFVFMHRWGGRDGKSSRLYLSDADGTNLRLIMDSEIISHYSWINEVTLVVWGRTKEQGDGYYIIDVERGTQERIGGNLNKHGDGHPSISEESNWLVTDSYANDAQIRHLIVHNVANSRTLEVGKFHSSIRLRGEKSCDLHPRWSPDGKLVSFDSSHNGYRCNYIADLAKILP